MTPFERASQTLCFSWCVPGRLSQYSDTTYDGRLTGPALQAVQVHADVTRQALVECDAAASLEKAYQQEENSQVLSAMEGCFQSLLQPGSSAASSPGRWRPLPTAPEPA